MDRVKGVWAWIRKNAAALIVALVAAVGAGIFWSYHRGKVRSLKTQVAVEEAHKKVAALDARREVLAEHAAANQEAIQAVQKERREIQREAVALEIEVAGMADLEVLAAFRDLY